MNIDLPARLKKHLQQPLPGESAQYIMAPAYRKMGSFREEDLSSYRVSAVTLLFCHRGDGRWFIPLTLRHDYEGFHSSQVSLPGGKKEETDKSLAHTALRECYEEIGIKENVELLGELSTLHIPVSKYIVHPFVAVNGNTTFVYTSQESEVKAIIELPIADLLDDKKVLTGPIDLGRSQTVNAPYFLVNDLKVWGATAMILSELRVLLQGLNQTTF